MWLVSHPGCLQISNCKHGCLQRSLLRHRGPTTAFLPPYSSHPKAEGDRQTMTVGDVAESNKASSVCTQQPSRQQQAWLLRRDSLIPPPPGFWVLALSSFRGSPVEWNVDTKDRSPSEAQATIWLWRTHLQVKELAVPPVDSLGGGVGPGHVDNIYLWEEKEERGGEQASKTGL